jgi:beta-lactamase class A
VGPLLTLFEQRARAVAGRVGAVVIDGHGEEILAIDPDGSYPAASTIKLPLVMTLWVEAVEKRLSLQEMVPVGAHVGGSGVLNGLSTVEQLSLHDLAALAIGVSDNTATNRLIERVGIDRVNQQLDEWGCPRTRLQRGMFDLVAKAAGRENVMSPRETASLLVRVRDGERAGDLASSAVHELLERNSDRTRLGRYLQPAVRLAHKDGWLEGVENDAGIVSAMLDVVAVGFTHGLDPLMARHLLGLLGLGAAELAGAEIASLPIEAIAAHDPRGAPIS